MNQRPDRPGRLREQEPAKSSRLRSISHPGRDAGQCTLPGGEGGLRCAGCGADEGPPTGARDRTGRRLGRARCRAPPWPFSRIDRPERRSPPLQDAGTKARDDPSPCDLSIRPAQDLANDLPSRTSDVVDQPLAGRRLEHEKFDGLTCHRASSSPRYPVRSYHLRRDRLDPAAALRARQWISVEHRIVLVVFHRRRPGLIERRREILAHDRRRRVSKIRPVLDFQRRQLLHSLDRRIVSGQRMTDDQREMTINKPFALDFLTELCNNGCRPRPCSYPRRSTGSCE